MTRKLSEYSIIWLALMAFASLAVYMVTGQLSGGTLATLAICAASVVWTMTWANEPKERA